MKIYKLPQLADSTPTSEFRLGPENSSAASVYLVYGKIRPGEAARKVACAAGHEEIICVVKGALKVKHGRSSFSVTAGEAFHAKEADTLYLENTGIDEAVYLAAGALTAKPGAVAKPVPKEENSAAGEAVSATAAPPEEDEFEITADDEPEAEDGKNIG
ncbi:MAG: hypothetical protein HY889_00635 [Deltaproteobacteria bacterium]|nr:hypothetical protein [Deltaproteobacteria bacterium]